MKQLSRILSLLLLAVVSFQCFPKFDEPVAPNWDTQVALPIMNGSYTIRDLLSKGSGIDTNSVGEMFYVSSDSAKPAEVGDALQIHPDSTAPITLPIGEFQVKAPPPIATTVKLLDSIPDPGPPFPDTTVLPSHDTTFTTDLGGAIDEFQFVQFSSGTMRLTIKNNLPVTISFPSPLIIFNSSDASQVASFNLNAIASGDSITAEQQLNGIIIRNQLGITAHIQTATGTAHLPLGGDNLKISFGTEILDAKATSASAKIPRQQVASVTDSIPFITDDSTGNAQPTKITEASFKHGRLYFVVQNRIDLNVGLFLQLNEFVDKITHLPLTIDTTIDRFQSSSNGLYIKEIELKNYNIHFPSGESNSFTFTAKISNLDSSNDYRTINSTDFVKTFIASPADSSYILESVTGIVHPFSSSIEKTLDINLGNVDPHFTGSVLFSGATIGIKLKFNGGINTFVDMKIIGINSATNVTDTISIPDSEKTLLPFQENIINLDLDTFISHFSYPNLPDKIKLTGTASFNPDYVSGSVSDTTAISSILDFSMPFKLKIDNATYLDTLEKSGIDQKTLENINSGSINFVFDNGLPLGIKYVMDVVDSIYLLGDTVNGAKYHQEFSIDSSLYSQGLPKHSTAVIAMNNAQAHAVAKGTRVIFSLGVQTSGNGIVIFHTYDKINVKVSASLSYHVEPNSKASPPPAIIVRKGE